MRDVAESPTHIAQFLLLTFASSSTSLAAAATMHAALVAALPLVALPALVARTLLADMLADEISHCGHRLVDHLEQLKLPD
jgi:hypothetical protein